MKQAVLNHWDLPGLSVTALVIFVVAFAVYAWWTYRKSNKDFYEDMAKIPLDDKEHV
jgi:cbb3-type cytochrome oxidase subunit 3